jgi:hypothetical protein
MSAAARRRDLGCRCMVAPASTPSVLADRGSLGDRGARFGTLFAARVGV